MSDWKHPIMYDEADPVFQSIRTLALGFPGADMKVTHGRPAFFTKKIFVYYSGSQKVDGEYVSHDQAIMVQPDPDDRRGLEADDRFWVPAYLGPYGWLGLDVADAADDDEIAELVEASYRQTTGKRLIAELDAR